MRPKRRYILCLPLFLCAVSLAPCQRASNSLDPDQVPHTSFEGAKLFQHYCAACHGSNGRGSGGRGSAQNGHATAAPAPKNAVPDLTLIAQRNGGKFPYRHVREVIEGKDSTLIHSSREMPIWGPILHEIEADQDWGEVRLEAITRHIEAIQQK